MKTIEEKIDALQNNSGWSTKYYLLDENNDSLIKITKAKVDAGDLSSIDFLFPSQTCHLISVHGHTKNRKIHMVEEITTWHIPLDKNKRLNKSIGLCPSSQTSFHHINIIIKDIFNKLSHAYLSSKMAMNFSLVREIKMSNIDNIIPHTVQKFVPISLEDKLEYGNRVILKEGINGNTFGYLGSVYRMYLREIDLGLCVDEIIFSKLHDVLEASKKA